MFQTLYFIELKGLGRTRVRNKRKKKIFAFKAQDLCLKTCSWSKAIVPCTGYIRAPKIDTAKKKFSIKIIYNYIWSWKAFMLARWHQTVIPGFGIWSFFARQILRSSYRLFCPHTPKIQGLALNLCILWGIYWHKRIIVCVYETQIKQIIFSRQVHFANNFKTVYKHISAKQSRRSILPSICAHHWRKINKNHPIWSLLPATKQQTNKRAYILFVYSIKRPRGVAAYILSS